MFLQAYANVNVGLLEKFLQEKNKIVFKQPKLNYLWKKEKKEKNTRKKCIKKEKMGKNVY
jgi:hypothetical protein